MKRQVLRILVAALLCLTMFAVLPGTAFAGTTYQHSGLEADASFYSEGSDGSYTWVDVLAGNWPAGPAANISIHQYIPGETPEDDIYREINGYVSPADFSIDKSLTAASLSAVIEADVYEFKGSPDRRRVSGEEGSDPGIMPPEPVPSYTTTLTVNLNWTGVGALTRSHYNSQSKYDDSTVNSRDKSTQREATVSGTIVDENGIDFADSTSSMSWMYNSKSSSTISGPPQYWEEM